ncbi:hypothetical protein A3F02_01175 [Candidatus Curtissbacteria bacterium RIFCSPHIGHO2_12_FULL_38_9b]|uniref:Glycosyltransferase RgtA/B/C/D-like domain-containing protein n=2 Tax=Candidatus Curtissiibacteriota TaxID=1752717 RepID=A0A1F5GT37_9BACT|nr:MAG: hypothetical protein A3A48_02270 [Candidatus Curtissbacteria bacterium RIFCSPLOWO2_01_FULL_37_9]OGD95040.1 MAG: hypothetical protein A3F02_01175 [Candidatus Curtissbacteria bacterium RIFCSPHIGHO2_12_FULL_38_9b]
MTKIISQYKYHFLIFLLSFIILTSFNFDPDLGWHLAYGQRFLESGEIIRSDQFSWTMPQYEWGNSYFAYQVLVAFLFKYLGHIITAMVFGIIASVGVMILLPKKLNIFKTLIVGLGTGVLVANLGLRPHTVSFLMFAILLVFLSLRLFDKKFYIFFWLVFFAVWANLHRGFVVGIIVLAIYFGLDLFLLEKKNKKTLLFIRITSFVCALLGTLISPFIFKTWHSGVFLDLTSRPNLFNIAEWQSPAVYFPQNVLLAISGVIFIYIFIKESKKIEFPLFLIAAFLFAFSFLAITFVFYWVAIFIFLTTRYFDLEINFRNDFMAKLPIILSTLAVGIALLLSFISNLVLSVNFNDRLIKDGYPAAAIKFIRDEKLNGNLYNEYAWGGFLIWQLPQAKVFIDGRMAAWKRNNGDSILNDYLAIRDGKCDVAKSYDIKILLIKKDAQTPCFDTWQIIFSDSIAKVLIKPNIDI